MEIVTVKAKPRSAIGTRASRKYRATGELPAVIYGHGEAPESVLLHEHEVEVALTHGARTLKVETGGKLQYCLIKEVQYDHLDIIPIHMDLARVSADERVRVKVGIELRGTPKGVSEGGVLDLAMGEIEVECTVSEIPDVFRIAVSHLGLGDALLVKDLPIPPGVKPIPAPDARVAAVRVLGETPEAAAPVEGEEGATAEPEVISRGKKVEEGEEAD